MIKERHDTFKSSTNQSYSGKQVNKKALMDDVGQP